MSVRRKSTKCQWAEESILKNHCAKMRLSKRYFKSVSSTKRGTRGGGLKKMHSSAIYKGYALYKIDGNKYIATTELYMVSICANIFSEFLLWLFRDILLIFLLYGFSKHAHFSVLSLSLFVQLAFLCFSFCILYQSCSHFTGHMWGFLSLSFMHICFIGQKSNSKVS